MSFLRTLALLILLTISVRADAIECLPHKDSVKILFQNGYAWHSTSITDQGLVMQVFINMKTREWLLLMIDDNLDACVVAHGQDWYFTTEREI